MALASEECHETELRTLSLKHDDGSQPSTDSAVASVKNHGQETRNDNEIDITHTSGGPSSDYNASRGANEREKSDSSLESTECNDSKQTRSSPTTRKHKKSFSACLNDISSVPSPPNNTREVCGNRANESNHHRRQYSLASLASPSPVLDGLDSPHWNKLFNDDARLALSDHADQVHQEIYLYTDTSAKYGQPQIPNDTSHQRGTGESGIMDLLGGAFENLGEDDRYSLEDLGDVCSSPLAPRNRMHRVSQGNTAPRDRQGVDISLPSLQHTRSHSSFIGDLSPIKISSNEAEGSASHRRIYSLTQPLAFDVNHSRNPSMDGDMAAHPTHDNNRQHGEGERTNLGFVSKATSLLQSSRKAFECCTYLLPCLRIAVYGEQNGEASSHQDILIASRRVESAICAFGGTSRPIARGGASIFRPGEALSPHNPFHDALHYQSTLYSRCFFRTEARLSWDVEENPPVSVAPTSLKQQMSSSGSTSQKKSVATKKTPKRVLPTKERPSASPPGIVSIVSNGKTPSGNGPTLSMIAQSSGTEPPKMKYRCKKCGKPKQNHQCVYREKLTREIGVRVYPVVNAFAVNEPGGEKSLSLRAMNNFVAYKSEPMDTEPVPSPTSDRDEANHKASNNIQNVTPDNSKMLDNVHSPQSSLSTLSSNSHFTPPTTSTGLPAVSATRGDSRKRSFDDMSPDGSQQPSPGSASDDAGRVITLRPEQFRAVTPCKTEDPAAYQYQSLPLPAQQRKRLSDSLFYWAQKAQLGNECAIVLRDARDKSQWDQAVAELTAQVLVAVHCQAGDSRFDGLRRYLLSIGIAC